MKIELANAISLATEFAIKLLGGFLNLRTDYEADGYPLVEITHTTDGFTTKRMEWLRAVLEGYRMSSLEATNAKSNPDSQWSRSRLRHITVTFVRENEDRGAPVKATFDVYQNYLDGDTVEGWTRWMIKNVHVFINGTDLQLIPEYPNANDREPIWGTRVS